MKVLVAVPHPDWLNLVFQLLKPTLDITFTFPNFGHDEGKVNFEDKTFRLINFDVAKKFFAQEDYEKIFVFAPEDAFLENELLNLGADGEKIFSMQPFIEQDGVKKFLLLQEAERQLENFQVLALGNDSAFMGLDLNLFNLPAVNFSAHDQDLYVSKLYLQKIFAARNNIKYLLLGLSPQAFRFDLSRSKFRASMLTYWAIFHDAHNLPVDEKILAEIFADSVFDSANYSATNSVAQIDYNDPFGDKKNLSRPLRIDDFLGLRARAKKYLCDGEEVFQENVKIFTEIIELCKKNSVTPIVFTAPVTEVYREYFDKNILHEFKLTMHKLQKNLSFRFLDYWQSKKFGPADFCDSETLNSTGAKNFTPYISNYVDKLERGKIKLAFVMQFTGSWTKIIPLYKKMCESGKFDMYGIVCPHDMNETPKLHSGEPITCEYGREYKYFHDLYDADENMTLIDVVQGDDWIDIENFHFDYVFYLRPYDYSFREPLKCQTVSKFAKTWQILYGAVSSDNFIGFYLGFQEFYNALDLYFTSSEEMRDAFNRVYRTAESGGEQKFVFLGLPELEEACSKAQNIHVDLDAPKKSVLWTPRWTYIENIGGSHFVEYRDNFTALHKKYPDLQLTVRPHPNLLANMVREGHMTEAQVQEYKNSLAENNVKLDVSETYATALQEADVLIADQTSIMIDYFLTGKPMIYCPSKFNFIGDCKYMAQGLYIAQDWSEVEKYLAMLLAGEDPLKDERRRLFEVIYARHKNSCERIINTLVEDYHVAPFKK